jgi:hypothetical protein
MARHAWLVFLVACGSSSSEAPTAPADPLPAPAPVSSPAPYQPAAKVAQDQQAQPDPRRAAIKAQEAEARRIADLLTGDPSKPVEADMTMRRRPGADLAGQIADVRDSGRVVSIGGGGTSRGGGGDRVGTAGGPAVAGLGGAASPPPSGPAGRISVAGKAGFDESSLSPDMVLMKMQSAYMAGIRRCYKNALKADPTAKGRVKIAFTVNETGRAVNGSTMGFSTEVDSCITGQISSWRFPVPKDKDGEATTASFNFNLNMIPD